MKIFNKIVIGFLFILLLFSVVLIANFYQAQKVDQSFKWLSRSEDVLKNSAELQKSIADVQSDIRGYLITGSESYLWPYDVMKTTSDSMFNIIQGEEVNDAPMQEIQIIKIRDSFASWLELSSNTIANYRYEFNKYGKDYAVQAIAAKMLTRTPKKFSQLRKMLSDFDTQEYRLREVRHASYIKSRKFSNIISFSLVLSAFIIGIGTLIIVSLSIRKRIQTLTNATQKIAGGDYGFRIHDQSRDELLALSRAINTMTESLQNTFSKLKQSNKDLEQFAWISSHDLKEPLRMVSIYAQLIENKYKGKLDEDADIAIKFITDGVKKMYSLINGLLEYARIGGDGVVFEPVSLTDCVESASTNMGKLIEERNVKIKYNDLPDNIKGTKVLLIQVFQNLIHNAIKFNESKDPNIQIGAKRNGQKEWEISIRDNGLGIDEKYKNIVFVMFQRFQDNEKYEGTGIGLSHCKKIVELHGGRIWFESAPGQGTTFIFTLPAA